MPSRYLEDGQGQVDLRTSAVGSQFRDDPERKRHADFARKVFKERRKKAKQSLAIDPTGIDWLKQDLKFELKVRESESALSGIDQTSEDPEITGLRIGIERYRQIYDQAVLARARFDKPNPVRQTSARIRRTLRLS